jgi:1-acyl-sn-glycerol-3-phosphate acyltransferase
VRVPPRLVRRVLIDPLWVPLAIAISVLLFAIALFAAVLAPVTRKRRVLRVAMLACVYLYLDLGLMLGGARLWLRHPIHHRDEQKWRAQHTALLARALTRLMAAAHRLVGYDVQFVGSEPHTQPDRPLIVLARHAGPGDSFTLVHLLATRFRRNPRVILKQALQWDPGLDVLLTRLRCHFLPSRSGAGEDRTAAVAELSKELNPGDALLLFPEGGNWTPRRHRRSVVRLLKAGRRREASRVRARTTVLPPRPGGTVAALAARGDTDVLVLAHAGLDTLVNPGQMWRALPLRHRPMRIRAWLHPAATVPREEQAIRRWLDDQWDAVDQWVKTEKRHD